MSQWIIDVQALPSWRSLALAFSLGLPFFSEITLATVGRCEDALEKGLSLSEEELMGKALRALHEANFPYKSEPSH